MKAAAGMRLASIDALRGTTVAAMLLVNNPGDWSHVYAPLRHALWHGLTPTDLIFPFFLFLVGVSLAFSVAPRAGDHSRRPALARGVVQRALRILLGGVALHLLAWWLLSLPHFRLWGVLQRIAVCAAAVGLMAVWLRPRAQWTVLGLALAVHAGVLLGAGSLQPWQDPGSRLDTALFAPWLYQYDAVTGRGHDPEGLLSTLGAVATTLLGLRAGDLLRRGALSALGLAGAALLAIGLLAATVLPLNKALWTPSFVAVTGGIAALALLAAHMLIDRRGAPAWGRCFGVNAITAYLGSSVLALMLIASGAWTQLNDLLAGWLHDPAQASLACALLFVALWWGLVRWLDARGIHVRI